MPYHIDIWHNILWSRYKGAVFSALHALNDPHSFEIKFFQIAETDQDRAGLSNVDTSYHNYPYTLLFQGALSRVGFLKKLLSIARLTLRSDADITLLTGYERPETWLQILIIKLKRKKAVLFCDSTIYDNPQSLLSGLLKRIIFTSADGIFGYGQRAKEYAVHYGTNPSRIHFRCQAAALPHNYDPQKALEGRLSHAATPASPRFLYVGRLSPEKNLGRLLEAFSTIKKSHAKAELVLVGSGKEQASLEATARKLDLNPNELFLGSKSGEDLFKEYARATCLVLPSISEPWGLVVNEAMHYGCPAIVSERCGCVPELVLEGKTGFCHKAFDVDDLAAKMRAAIASFADTEKTARACLDLIKNYTPEKAAQQILRGCQQILTR